jgi:hypothetical protein
MNFFVLGFALTTSLFLAVLAGLFLGRWLGRRALAKDPESARSGYGAVEGAIFGLLGLLIAFTFSGAAARFDARKALIAQEANEIGTAWLRLDLLPAAAQPALREDFRRYLDARIEYTRRIADPAARKEFGDRVTELQGRIWSGAAAACEGQSPAVASLVLASLNSMIDITTTRLMAAETHPPVIIYLMLVLLALVSALLAGHAMASNRTRSWLHMVGFALMIAVTVRVILDIEFPRVGWVTLDRADHVLVELRQSMK